VAWRRSIGGRSGSSGVAVAQTFDGGRQRRQVVLDGGRDDRVARVEVAMSQVISHSRDLCPWDFRLSADDVGWK
jgi:hypothetical protein